MDNQIAHIELLFAKMAGHMDEAEIASSEDWKQVHQKFARYYEKQALKALSCDSIRLYQLISNSSSI